MEKSTKCKILRNLLEKIKKGKFERYWSTTSTPDYSFGIGSDFQLGKTYYFKVRAVSGNKVSVQ